MPKKTSKSKKSTLKDLKPRRNAQGGRANNTIGGTKSLPGNIGGNVSGNTIGGTTAGARLH